MNRKSTKSNSGKQSESKMIRYAVRIPMALKKRIDAHKERTGVQHWHFTMKALEEKLAREEAA